MKKLKLTYMKFDYLGGNSWNDISREERYYCTELYYYFRNNLRPFLKLVAEKTKVIASEEISNKWSLNYEVCFYRDFIFANRKFLITEKIFERYPQKRTFDLCLYSEGKIIICEAKVQQSFNVSQNSKFLDDLKKVIKLIKEAGFSPPTIDLIGIAGSAYFQNVEKFGNGIPELFKEKFLTWSDIYDITGCNIFKLANDIYKK